MLKGPSGRLMNQTIVPTRRLKGEAVVPGDRHVSLCRAVLAAICEGTTQLDGYAPDPDCKIVLEALRTLGVPVEEDGGKARIGGVGLRGLKQPPDELYCGSSQTGVALLCGLLAGQGWDVALTGSEDIGPVASFVDPLRGMGAQITCKDDGQPPIHITGSALSGLHCELPARDRVAKSALLLAGLYADGETTIWEEGTCADHLERALQDAGAPIQTRVVQEAIRRDPDDLEAELDRRMKRLEGALKRPPRREITLSGGTSCLRGRDMAIPGDMSLASFFLAAGTIVPSAELIVRNVEMSPARMGIVEALKSMGGDISTHRVRKERGEPVGDLVVRRSELRGIRVGGEAAFNMMDEVPALAIAATQAFGETLIRDVGVLRNGRIDRLSALAACLKQMGAKIGELPDGLIIEGGRPLDGIDADSQGDPQVAMALAVAGLVAYGRTVIDHAECVEPVFPGFFEQLTTS